MGWPTVSTGNDIFDALYALSLEEVRESSVDAIHDGSFNGGRAQSCPEGGCFETGRRWTYVWTRDTSYAVDLALAALDPTRARNSLEFKLSERREAEGGDDRQIIQDTGSGGSYPISSDRVVWAMGASQLINYLDGTEREAFASLAYEAISNTLEHDRAVIFDASTGLYRGEQSFLDWREQSYPEWTVADSGGTQDPTAGRVVHIGMSQALSTNLAHLRALEIAADLARGQGEEPSGQRYRRWATELRVAIHGRFFLGDHRGYSTYLTTFLDPAPVDRFDLLGSALAVLAGLGDETQRRGVVASYPHLPQGAPVIWPQQPLIPIYHNRALWPFVTAYWLRAARSTRHDQAATHSVLSLMRGAALNLSNMENFEAVTGRPWLDDGDASGPRINSQRQLWSVAGYVSMVHDVIFGLEADPSGVRFSPYVTKELRHRLFGNTNTIVLNDFPYRGRTITVIVELPALSADRAGAYQLGEVRLNGRLVPLHDFIGVESLDERNLIHLRLVDAPERTTPISLVSDTESAVSLFGPKTPTITDVALGSAGIRVRIATQRGEPSRRLTLRIFRDGELRASNLEARPGTEIVWTDPDTTSASPSHCYTVEARFVDSGNASHHARPRCYVGRNGERLRSVGAQSFERIGGSLSRADGVTSIDGWGDPGDALAVPSFTPTFTGPHLIWLLAGNSAGPLNTGITCGVKRIDIEELGGRGGECGHGATGYLVVPHVGDGSRSPFVESSIVRAHLCAGRSYRMTIRHDARSTNMSAFRHFESYEGAGGRDGPYSQVSVAELVVLSLTGNR